MSTDPPIRRGTPAASPVESLLASLEAESQALRADVHSAEQARKRSNQINFGVLLVLALFVGMVLVIGWQNNQVITQVQRTNNAIADCSTVGGTCYEEGRKRTAEAIGTLTRISIFVSQCARLFPGEVGPEYDKKIEACVMDRLAKAQAAATPSPRPAPDPSSRN